MIQVFDRGDGIERSGCVFGRGPVRLAQFKSQLGIERHADLQQAARTQRLREPAQFCGGLREMFEDLLGVDEIKAGGRQGIQPVAGDAARLELREGVLGEIAGVGIQSGCGCQHRPLAVAGAEIEHAGPGNPGLKKADNHHQLPRDLLHLVGLDARRLRVRGAVESFSVKFGEKNIPRYRILIDATATGAVGEPESFVSQ